MFVTGLGNISGQERLTKMKGALLLNVVVRKSTTVLELFPSEDEALLVGRDTLLVLDFGLDVIDGVGRLDLKGDGLASEGLYEDLCKALVNVQ